jgi:hypothetical protein
LEVIRTVLIDVVEEAETRHEKGNITNWKKYCQQATAHFVNVAFRPHVSLRERLM